jgi:hypothetical protein
MLIDVSIMPLEQSAWVEKNEAMIQQHGVWSHMCWYYCSCALLRDTCVLLLMIWSYIELCDPLMWIFKLVVIYLVLCGVLWSSYLYIWHILLNEEIKQKLTLSAKMRRATDGMDLFFKASLVGTPRAEWCGKRTFPHKGDLGFIPNSQGRLRCFLFFTL